MRASPSDMAVVGQPPPAFFRRGLAPVTRLVVLVGLSLALIIIDLRYQYLEVLRQTVSVVSLPLQEAAFLPARVTKNTAEYLTDVTALQSEIEALKAERAQSAGRLLREAQLESENARLRELLQLRGEKSPSGVVGEVFASVRDPFSRRVMVDKGLQHGVELGQIVVDSGGVIGQITRVYPFVSELALVTDKALSVPVQVSRNGLRGVVFGAADGTLEMRYVPANADVQTGDALVTSGLDGIYQPGLPVARVASVLRDSAYAYARIVCVPASTSDKFRHVLVLGNRAAAPEAPEAHQPKAEGRPGKRGRR